jgi:CheY-like chemotaxis protein
MATILIIDDDAQVRSLIRMILEGMNHEVFEAEEGKAGMEQLRDHNIDLLMTDLVMEGQGGLETIAQVRRELPYLKIVAMSGGSANAKENLETAVKLGAHVALSKPFTFATLRSTVDGLLHPPGLAADSQVG